MDASIWCWGHICSIGSGSCARYYSSVTQEWSGASMRRFPELPIESFSRRALKVILSSHWAEFCPTISVGVFWCCVQHSLFMNGLPVMWESIRLFELCRSRCVLIERSQVSHAHTRTSLLSRSPQCTARPSAARLELVSRRCVLCFSLVTSHLRCALAIFSVISWLQAELAGLRPSSLFFT